MRKDINISKKKIPLFKILFKDSIEYFQKILKFIQKFLE